LDTSDATLTNFISNEYLLEPNTQASQFHRTANPSTNIHRDVAYNHNTDNNFFSYEDLMKYLPFTGDNAAPTSAYTNENMDTVSKNENIINK
jgi:hypothetical protein